MGTIALSSEARFGVFRTPPGVVLLALLTVLILAAGAFQRDVDRLSPREVSFLLAGHSLAHDRDLRITDADRARVEALSLPWSSQVARVAGEGGERFDLPVAYPLIMAPFVWLAPLRGPLIVNALLVSLGALLVAYRVGRRLGRDALTLVAVCLFASVIYRNVFLVQPTSLLVFIIALAFSTLLRHEEPARHGVEEVYRPAETPVGGVGLSLVVGLVIGVAVVHHPLYLLLALPAGLALPAAGRRASLIGLLLGLISVVLLSWLLRGPGPGFSSVGIGELEAGLGQVSTGASAWNLLYFGVGRNTGLVPYFLPLLLVLGLWQGGAGRSSLALTALVGAVGPALLVPFNYFDGPAAVGNGWAVPWLVLLLFIPTRPLPKGWLIGTLLLAAPAMYPTWLAPGIEPITEQGTYRHTQGRFHRWLPVETTQEPLPPSGQESGERLWIRSLSLEARLSGGNRWHLEGDGWAELQIATPTPLEAVHLQYGPAAEPELEVRGGDLGDTVLLPDGGIGFRVENLKRRALHPMWWSAERHHNYVLQLSMPQAVSRSQSLVVTAIAEDVVRTQP